MNYKMEDERIERLVQIGSIFDSIGVSTVEIAEKIKEHIEGCPGGKACIEKILSENKR